MAAQKHPEVPMLHGTRIEAAMFGACIAPAQRSAVLRSAAEHGITLLELQGLEVVPRP